MPRGTHKYIRREGTPGNYRYFYADAQGREKPATDEKHRNAVRDHIRRLIIHFLGQGARPNSEVMQRIANEVGVSVRTVWDNLSNMRQRGSRRVRRNEVSAAGQDLAAWGHDYDTHHINEAGSSVGSVMNQEAVDRARGVQRAASRPTPERARANGPASQKPGWSQVNDLATFRTKASTRPGLRFGFVNEQGNPSLYQVTGVVPTGISVSIIQNPADPSRVGYVGDINNDYLSTVISEGRLGIPDTQETPSTPPQIEREAQEAEPSNEGSPAPHVTSLTQTLSYWLDLDRRARSTSAVTSAHEWSRLARDYARELNYAADILKDNNISRWRDVRATAGIIGSLMSGSHSVGDKAAALNNARVQLRWASGVAYAIRSARGERGNEGSLRSLTGKSVEVVRPALRDNDLVVLPSGVVAEIQNHDDRGFTVRTQYDPGGALPQTIEARGSLAEHIASGSHLHVRPSREPTPVVEAESRRTRRPNLALGNRVRTRACQTGTVVSMHRNNENTGWGGAHVAWDSSPDNPVYVNAAGLRQMEHSRPSSTDPRPETPELQSTFEQRIRGSHGRSENTFQLDTSRMEGARHGGLHTGTYQVLYVHGRTVTLGLPNGGQHSIPIMELDRMRRSGATFRFAPAGGHPDYFTSAYNPVPLQRVGAEPPPRHAPTADPHPAHRPENAAGEVAASPIAGTPAEIRERLRREHGIDLDRVTRHRFGINRSFTVEEKQTLRKGRVLLVVDKDAEEADGFQSLIHERTHDLRSYVSVR